MNIRQNKKHKRFVPRTNEPNGNYDKIPASSLYSQCMVLLKWAIVAAIGMAISIGTSSWTP